MKRPAYQWQSRIEGEAVIEAYTVHHGREGPKRAIIHGRLTGSGEVFLANDRDAETLARIVESDPLGAKISVERGQQANLFRFA